ncbi:UDP-N-acetylmuramate dehydrogenase [Salegentibacter sp. F188]|uniref:UDP-N-acetylenolpyruvoylglucosamine reductase n=1 Tax=Autumnicola patrickiae TaxID=3075591 RepID=A0ABU3DYS7_9FLAO|nr:UDP-N-acetylmuramate dehydrogenase [Salegentibacter sp. F188]MDT0688883.1 UDP-N-acetylmuramate dehydrogenase [Salegentibacter sp. F188]
MQVLHNASLKGYNTFGIEVRARKFISVTSVEDLKEVLAQTYASELFILGGGSNMLLTKDIDKTVLHIDLKGKEIVSQDEDEVLLKASAGENWHEFVLYTLEKGFGGLENLSLIPGKVGTAPIQNIGAYGVELKDVFEECEGIHIQTLEQKTFSKEACNFDYRNSVFKNKLKGQYIITSVTFRLSKKNHILRTSYGAIKTALDKKNISSAGVKDISDAVIAIRQEKLPDPKILGNSGSFFKNPVIPVKQFEDLQQEYPEMPSYPLSDHDVKIPAGWLIENTGLKGYREGDAGVHKNQALVLVNYGAATGIEILQLSQKIQRKVEEKFQIRLEPEVNIF